MKNKNFFSLIFWGFLAIGVAVQPSAQLKLRSYADVVEQLAPTVVNIGTKTAPTKAYDGHSYSTNPFDGTPFAQLFEGFGFSTEHYDGTQEFSMQDRTPERALGSGVVIDRDGHIVTNHHVIDGADEVFIKFKDNDTEYAAEVVGTDPKTDLALLKLIDRPTGRLRVAKLGDSATLRVGDPALAIGNPFGLAGSVSAGIISGLGRNIGEGPYDAFIQTDAAINPGNSGGPLFNGQGEVVGINTVIATGGGGSDGVGFAVPVNTVKLIVAQLKEHGRPIRGWLGVRIQKLTDGLAQGLNLAEVRGVLVSEVVPNSPADKGGLKPGDVLLAYDQVPVKGLGDLPRLVAETPVDKRVRIDLLRDGRDTYKTVQIAELEEDLTHTTFEKRKAEKAPLGLAIQSLTNGLREQFNVPDDVEGVFVMQTRKGSPAGLAGLRRGDVIASINTHKTDRPIKAQDQLKQATGGSALLYVWRDGMYLYLTLDVPKEE